MIDLLLLGLLLRTTDGSVWIAANMLELGAQVAVAEKEKPGRRVAFVLYT